MLSGMSLDKPCGNTHFTTIFAGEESGTKMCVGERQMYHVKVRCVVWVDGVRGEEEGVKPLNPKLHDIPPDLGTEG